MSIKAILLAAALVSLSTSVSAATVSFGPVSGSGSDSYSFSGGGSGSVSLSIDMILQQFDPALGTLTGVDVTLEFVTQSSSGSITNNGSNTIGPFGVGFPRATFFSAPGGVGKGIGLGSTFFVPDLAPGQSLSGGPGGLISSIQGTYAASTLGPYIGIGTVTATLNHNGSVSIDSCDTCATLDTIGSYSATVRSTITYTFEPAVVPVPAAAWLFGSGILGLIGIARRKKV
jgi:hypothetical protein